MAKSRVVPAYPNDHPRSAMEKEAFLYAVDDVNANNGVLADRHVIPVVYDTAEDTWTGFQSAVEGFSRGAVAVVEPGLSTVATFVSPLATHTQIPFVTPSARELALAFHEVHRFVLQLAPSDRLLSQAVTDLLVKFGWQHVGIVRSRDRSGLGNLVSMTRIKLIYIAEIPPLTPDEETPATISAVADLVKQLKYNNARIIVVSVPDYCLYAVFKAVINWA